MSETFQVLFVLPAGDAAFPFSTADGAVLASYAPASGSGTYHAKLFDNGEQFGNSAPIGPLQPAVTNGVTFPAFVVPGGVYTLQVFADGDDSTVLAETPVSAFIAANTVTVTGLAGFVAKLPNVWTAQNPLAAGGWAFGLANVPSSGATVYAGLFNVTTSAYAGGLVALTGVAGLLPDFTSAAAAGGTFAIKLCADSAGADVLATGASVTAGASGAAPSVVQVASVNGEATAGSIALPNPATAGNTVLLLATSFEMTAPLMAAPSGFTTITQTTNSQSSVAFAVFSGPASALTNGTTVAYAEPENTGKGAVYLVETTAASYALTTATQTTDNTPSYECTIDGATTTTLNIGLQILYVPANSGPTSVPSPAAILAENGGEAQGDGASLLWTNTTATAATFTRAGGVNISGVAAIGILGTA